MYVQKVTVGVTHLIPLQFAHCNIHQFFILARMKKLCQHYSTKKLS